MVQEDNMDEKQPIIPNPKEVRTEEGELVLMAEFSQTPTFNVLRRWTRRYVEKLKNQSYRLSSEDPKFAIRHNTYLQQGVGMEIMIKFIEGAAKQLEEMENGGPEKPFID